MERVNYHAYQALCRQYSVAVCGPEGAGVFAEKDTPIAESPLSPLSSYLFHTQWQALRMAWRVHPEIVYSGSGLTAPAALMAGRAAGAKTICFLHGLDIVAGHAAYRHIFLPAIRRFDRVLVNSQHTASLAMQAGIKIEKISIVHPGVELPEWDERESARLRFREKFGLKNKQLLLSAGRLTQRKGIAEFIRYTLPGIASRFPQTMLLIIGEEPKNALRHTQGVTDDIKKAIRETGLDDHVALLGGVDEKCLSDAYFASDIMIFPVLNLPGDVEGFGMVAIEAAAHGLLTLGFAVGGTPDAVAEGVSGCLLPFGDYASLAEQIIRKLETGIADRWSRQCRKHAEKFEWEIFRQRFLAACQA
ncbi:MAG TPA: glycosyltransferase family 4 protein [Methylophilaceae bacterium]|nr:glycosyltransferase family 4 protein [Methylophilaceae bacterium]